MKDLQKGSIEILMLAVFAIAIGFTTVTIVNSINSKNLFNQWNTECTKQGGIVGRVKQELFSTGYECFINGKITTLNGYEQYSTGVKN